VQALGTLVNVSAVGPISPEARHTLASVAARQINAHRFAAARVRGQGTFVDIFAKDSVALEARLTVTLVGANQINADCVLLTFVRGMGDCFGKKQASIT